MMNSSPLAPLPRAGLISQVKEEPQEVTFMHTTIIPRLLERGDISVSAAVLHDIRQQLHRIPRIWSTAPSSHPLKGLLLPTSFEERAHYIPFANIFNTIGSAWLASVASSTQYRNLMVYDRNMLNGVDGPYTPKPDLLTVLNRNNINLSKNLKYRYCWEDVGIVVEVKSKSKLPELVARAGTYARALFSAQPTRTFVLAIAYTYSNHHVRFLFFHRGGLHSSPCSLRSGNGLNGFIHGVILATALHHGLMSWTLWRNPTVGVPALFPFEVEECLYQGSALTGRCTAGHLLSRVRSGSTTAIPDSPLKDSVKLLQKRKNLRHSSISAKKRKISADISCHLRSSGAQTEAKSSEARFQAQENAFRFWQHAPLVKTNVGDEDESFPPQLFAKDTWASSGYNEAEIHQKMSGEFGAAELWAHQVLDSNELFYEDSESISPWHLFSHTRPEVPPGKVIHVVMYFSTIGQPLHNAKNVQQLLTAIFHAMLAHYAMFCKHKIIHRDISSSNIMMTEKRICRTTPTIIAPNDAVLDRMISSMVDIPCEGLLIDADLARHLHLPELSGGPISGTLAFISRRLHRQFVNGHPVQHTSSDDLESSIWVILWELYRQSEELDPSCSYLDGSQRSIYSNLQGDSDQTLRAKEIFNTKHYSANTFPQCPPLNDFMAEMLPMLRRMADNESLELDWMRYHYAQYFFHLWACLNSGHPTLSMPWEELFAISEEVNEGLGPAPGVVTRVGS